MYIMYIRNITFGFINAMHTHRGNVDPVVAARAAAQRIQDRNRRQEDDGGTQHEAEGGGGATEAERYRGDAPTHHTHIRTHKHPHTLPPGRPVRVSRWRWPRRYVRTSRTYIT